MEPPKISNGARKTREYLGELKRLGCRFVRPDAETLAELEAVRSLMSDARAGDLSSRGETIEPSEVSRFLFLFESAKLRPLLGELESGVVPVSASTSSSASSNAS